MREKKVKERKTVLLLWLTDLYKKIHLPLTVDQSGAMTFFYSELKMDLKEKRAACILDANIFSSLIQGHRETAFCVIITLQINRRQESVNDGHGNKMLLHSVEICSSQVKDLNGKIWQGKAGIALRIDAHTMML